MFEPSLAGELESIGQDVIDSGGVPDIAWSSRLFYGTYGTGAPLVPPSFAPDGLQAELSVAAVHGLRGSDSADADEWGSPGWYFFELRRDRRPATADMSLCRVYWNVSAEGAAALVHEVLGELKRSDAWLQLKLADHRALYARRDSAVLYVERSSFDVIGPSLRVVHDRLARWLDGGLPMFTKALASGLGVAEDPGYGSSFVLHRMTLVAEAAARAWRDGCRDSSQMVGAFESHFGRRGISPTSPHLNPGSRRDYDVSVRSSAPSRRDTLSVAGVESVTSELWLERATRVGRALCSTAILRSDRCVWFEAKQSDEGPEWTDVRSTGPDVWSGTAGVAIFLARLGRVTGEQRVMTASRAAIEHALRSMAQLPPQGLYFGQAGVATAAHEVGVALGDRGLCSSALRLIEALPRSGTGMRRGVSDGAAGTVVALLGSAELRQLRSVRDLCETLIEGLFGDWRADASMPRDHRLGDESPWDVVAGGRALSEAAGVVLAMLASASEDAGFALAALDWLRRSDEAHGAGELFSDPMDAAQFFLRTYERLGDEELRDAAQTALGAVASLAGLTEVDDRRRRGDWDSRSVEAAVGAELAMSGARILADGEWEGVSHGLKEEAWRILEEEADLGGPQGPALATPGLMSGAAGVGLCFLEAAGVEEMSSSFRWLASRTGGRVVRGSPAQPH